ncbi:hypothetical protein [Roseateles noduli]|uniref:hypothetical protein n=1 Tax=Roseateles noduli TaxID=2052484 RepID=UPI003D64F01E
MSRFSRRKPLAIELSRRSVHLGGAEAALAPARPWSSQEELRAALADAPRGAPWRVLVGVASARHFMVRPPVNARRLADLRAIAALRFEDLHGDSAADWLIEGDWDARRPFLCCAMPTALLRTLRDVAKQSGAGTPSVESAFCAAWNAAGARSVDDADWVLHTGLDGTLLAAAEARRVRAIGDLDWRPGEDEEALWQAAERLAMAWSLSPPAGLVLLGQGGGAPRRWTRAGGPA